MTIYEYLRYKIPLRVYIRYGLLTIPEMVVLILVLMVVQNWVSIPFWLRVSLMLLWVAKEVILFPIVWRAYDHAQSEVFHPMIGLRGITQERLAPAGYILVQGELWKAEKMPGEPPIGKNMWVRVQKIEGLKLYVEPEGTVVGMRKSECGSGKDKADGGSRNAEVGKIRQMAEVGMRKWER